MRARDEIESDILDALTRGDDAAALALQLELAELNRAEQSAEFEAIKEYGRRQAAKNAPGSRFPRGHKSNRRCW